MDGRRAGASVGQIDWECLQALGGDLVCRFLQLKQLKGRKQHPVGWSAMELWEVLRIGLALASHTRLTAGHWFIRRV